jgi:hypothetical protein
LSEAKLLIVFLFLFIEKNVQRKEYSAT